MKVGTDGTMLGCWADVSYAKNILDVGCGSGVLSIICAQKNPNAVIVGIDVEKGAITDALSNVQSLDISWKQRIEIIEARLQDYDVSQPLDLIISNPPFFENSQVSPDDARNYARHTNSLHYTDIFRFAEVNLLDSGSVYLVLPYGNGLEALEKSKSSGLYAELVCAVRPVPHKPPHRLLMKFVKQECYPKETELIIETGIERHDYTKEYQELGKDFYLYF